MALVLWERAVRRSNAGKDMMLLRCAALQVRAAAQKKINGWTVQT
jgi:hypothetical protein